MLSWKVIFWVGLERSEANLSDGVTVEVVRGLWWHVAEWAKSLGGAWRRMIWTMTVILEVMESPASDLLIGIGSKVIGRLWRDGVWRGGVSKTETLDGRWKHG